MRKLCLLLLVATLLPTAHSSAQRTRPPEPPRNRPTADLVLTPGVYVTRWEIRDTGKDVQQSPRGMGECSKTQFPTLKGKPSFVSTTPLFGRLVFYVVPTSQDAASSWLFALDESKGRGKGYDTLYLDLNGNADLSDDTGISGKTYKPEGADAAAWDAYQMSSVSFDSAATIAYNKLFPASKNTNQVALDVFYLREGDKQGLMATVRGAWFGEVDSNKGKIPFRLVDDDENGRFNDRRRNSTANNEPFFMEDHVAFDWNRTGKFLAERWHDEDVRLHAVNGIAGRLYVLNPDSAGSSLEIEDYTGPAIKLGMKLSKVGGVTLGKCRRFRAFSKSGSFDYDTLADGQTVDLPADDYDLDAVITCEYGKSVYEVSYRIHKPLRAAGTTTLLPVGGKIGMTIDPGNVIRLNRGHWSDGRLHLPLSSGGYVTMYGGSLKEPKVVLKNAAGKVVDTSPNPNGPGCWWIEFPKAADPKNPLPVGKYTIEAVFDTGPFGGVLRAKKPAVIQEPKP